MKTSQNGTSAARTGRPGGAHERIGAALIVTAALGLGGCLHWPDIATDCAAYGVPAAHRPMGEVVIATPLYREELDVRCAGVREAAAHINPDAQISGCVVPREDGVALAYYWAGDRCAMNHELCHALHGPQHTERYLVDLENGVPMPYCPENQLWPERG